MSSKRRAAITQTRDWTIDEFKTLLGAQGTPAADLVESLRGRTAGAISAVQQGVHAYHRGSDTSMLSALMVDYLKSHRSNVVCPVCGQRF